MTTENWDRNCFLNAPFDNYQFFYNDNGEARMFNIRTGRWNMPVIHTTGYYRFFLYGDGKHKGFKVHKLVCEYFKNKPTSDVSLETEHINRNRLDNSYINLMWRTRSQNLKNKNYTKGKKGYCFDKDRKKWRVNFKGKYIGLYDREEDAFEKVQELRREYDLMMKYTLMWMNRTFQSKKI